MITGIGLWINGSIHIGQFANDSSAHPLHGVRYDSEVWAMTGEDWLAKLRLMAKFILEVELDKNGNADAELGRILRYWGGNLKHYALQPGDGSAIYDSAYQEVGQWSIIESAES